MLRLFIDHTEPNVYVPMAHQRACQQCSIYISATPAKDMMASSIKQGSAGTKPRNKDRDEKQNNKGRGDTFVDSAWNINTM